MTPERPAVSSCVNTGCTRPAEEGERYCAACGLERSLFRRDSRREAPPARPSREPEARQR